MDLYSVFLILFKSVMLMPRFVTVDWILPNGTIIKMDMQTFTIRSYGETALRAGVPQDDIYAVLDKLHAPEEDYPTGEPYSVIFH